MSTDILIYTHIYIRNTHNMYSTSYRWRFLAKNRRQRVRTSKCTKQTDKKPPPTHTHYANENKIEEKAQSSLVCFTMLIYCTYFDSIFSEIYVYLVRVRVYVCTHRIKAYIHLRMMDEYTRYEWKCTTIDYIVILKNLAPIPQAHQIHISHGISIWNMCV